MTPQELEQLNSWTTCPMCGKPDIGKARFIEFVDMKIYKPGEKMKHPDLPTIGKPDGHRYTDAFRRVSCYDCEGIPGHKWIPGRVWWRPRSWFANGYRVKDDTKAERLLRIRHVEHRRPKRF